MSALHWRLPNALSPGIAWLWWCGCMLPCSGAHVVVWWQNHYFMYMVTFLLFRVRERSGGERVGAGWELCWSPSGRWFHTTKWRVRVMCRCEGALSWLWYLQNGVGHWQMDLVRTHPAKDPKISCLQPQIWFRWMSRFTQKMSSWVKKKMMELSITLVCTYSFSSISQYTQCRA